MPRKSAAATAEDRAKLQAERYQVAEALNGTIRWEMSEHKENRDFRAKLEQRYAELGELLATEDD